MKGNVQSKKQNNKKTENTPANTQLIKSQFLKKLFKAENIPFTLQDKMPPGPHSCCKAVSVTHTLWDRSPSSTCSLSPVAMTPSAQQEGLYWGRGFPFLKTPATPRRVGKAEVQENARFPGNGDPAASHQHWPRVESFRGHWARPSSSGWKHIYFPPSVGEVGGRGKEGIKLLRRKTKVFFF